MPAFNWVLNSNALGGVYAVCFAVAVGHGLSRDISARERGAAFVMALPPLAIVMLTQSRGALLGCIAALLVALLALPIRVSLVLAGMVAAAAALIAIAFPKSVQLIFGRADSSRFALWLHYLELSRDRPWLGHGLDFDTAYKSGGSPSTRRTTFCLRRWSGAGCLACFPWSSRWSAPWRRRLPPRAEAGGFPSPS